ncbi:MAG: hypothetical protein GEU97_17765 [Actinophytocola sp.]|nr:hypothetical protein [Actinophytocola sp.]
MDQGNYLVLLLLGTLIVVVDGQLLYLNGKRYLADASGGTNASGTSMARLISVLFHLLALGILALVSTIDIGGTGAQAIVARLGIVLLIVAIFHAIALGVLARFRQSQETEEHRVSRLGGRERQALYDPVVAPVSGQRGPEPTVSPDIEDEGPYSTSQ